MPNKNRDTLASRDQKTLRELRQEQKLRAISKDDNATTTGRLVNPPAAIVPVKQGNVMGSGGEAGGLGLFGANLGVGTQTTGAYGGSYNPTSPIRENVINTLTGTGAPVYSGEVAGVTNRSGYHQEGQAGVSVGSYTPKTSGSYMPSLVPVQNGFAGVQTGAGVSTTPFVNPFSSSVISNTYVSPYQQQPYQQAAPIPTGADTVGALSPDKQASIPASGLIGGDRPGALTSSVNYPAASYMAPQWQQLATNQAATGGPVRPSGVYDPSGANSQQWRDYWNQMAVLSAQNPAQYRSVIQAQAIAEGRPDPFAPAVMSREQIWQMKANQRRRVAANGEGETGGGLPPVQSVQPVPYTGVTGDYYSTILNTASG